MNFRTSLLLTGGVLALVKLAGDAAVRRYERADIEGGDLPRLSVEAAGLRFHYHDAGTGEPLVLLHGLGASTFSYRRNIQQLAASFRVIAVDLPGFGFSSRDVPDMSLSAQARYLAAFLDALGVERAALAGHSMGGTVAQRFALAYPERVSALVLICAASDAQMRAGAPLAPLLRPLLPAAVGLVLYWPRARQRWHQFAVYDPAHLTPEVIEGYARPWRIRGSVEVFRRLLGDRAKDRAIDISQIRAPTLVLTGEHDRLAAPTTAEGLARKIPGAELRVVARAGHWLQEEQPEEMNATVLAFLGGRGLAGPGRTL